MCSCRWWSASSIPASSSWPLSGTAGRSSPSPPRWLPRLGASRWWGRCRRPRRPSASFAACALGEALSRCPALHLVPPDPEGSRSLWGRVLDRLEGIGAAVESDRSGVAFFEAGRSRASTGTDLAGVLAAARRALGAGSRLGAAPSRFAAHAAALRARPRRRERVVAPPGRWWWRSGPRVTSSPRLPVALLRTRPELQALPEILEQLGIRTLGELAALPSRALAERFGHPGLPGARPGPGRDTRSSRGGRRSRSSERLDLPEAASGQQLERALELLVGRVLARRERRGRSLRGLAMSARFVAGGTWRRGVTLRRASADPARIRLRSPQAGGAAGPGGIARARGRGLRPARAGPGAVARRGGRRPARAAGRGGAPGPPGGGADAALRVLDVDPDSRIPERRAVLAPFPDWPAP